MDEEIQKMKLCRLCEFIDEENLHINDTWYHKEKGMHKIGNSTSAPLKGHILFELHKTWCKLLDLKI